jgi:hypothetical protein
VQTAPQRPRRHLKVARDSVQTLRPVERGDERIADFAGYAGAKLKIVEQFVAKAQDERICNLVAKLRGVAQPCRVKK